MPRGDSKRPRARIASSVGATREQPAPPRHAESGPLDLVWKYSFSSENESGRDGRPLLLIPRSQVRILHGPSRLLGRVAAYRVVADEGDIVPVELRLLKRDMSLGEVGFIDDPKPNDLFDTSAPLTTRLVRDIPFATHLREIKKIMAAADQVDDVSRVWARDLGFTQALIDEPVQRTSRREHGEDLYLAVARLYAEATKRQSRSPTKDTREGLPVVDPSWNFEDDVVENLVVEARRRGYLSRAPASGIPGGNLTDKAREILRRYFGDGPWESL